MQEQVYHHPNSSQQSHQGYQNTRYHNYQGHQFQNRNKQNGNNFSLMKPISCINCFNKGHTFKDCKFPIISYGIICYKIINGEPHYLLVQRRNTIGYIDFIRGNYQNVQQLEIIVNEMTYSEKQDILTKPFDELWDTLWMSHDCRAYKNDYRYAKSKFDELDINNLIMNTISETKWLIEEYSIPKGRINTYENIRECAIREFTEETSFSFHEIKLLKVDPIEELFYGSNGVFYRHIYYVAEIKTDREPSIDPNNVLQAGEIKQVVWKNYKETMNIFRNYETTKRNLIFNVNNMLMRYQL